MIRVCSPVDSGMDVGETLEMVGVVTVAVTLKLTEFEAALPGLLAVTLQVPGVSSLSNW
jgi:hypothetical protein